MKEVYLKKIKINNFMKYEDKEIEFGMVKNVFKGYNGVGKTTILHAINWCLTGKDYYDRAKFDIETLDENGDVLNEESTVSVEIEMLVNGKPYKILRTRSKGATKIKVDKKSMTQKVYDAFLKQEIGFDSLDVKLMTNPKYAQELSPTELQKVVMMALSDVTDDEILETDKKFAAIRNKIIVDGAEKVLEELNTTLRTTLKERRISLVAKVDLQSENCSAFAKNKINIGQLNLEEKQLRDKINNHAMLMVEAEKNKEEQKKEKQKIIKIADDIERIETGKKLLKQKIVLIKDNKDMFTETNVKNLAINAKKKEINQVANLLARIKDQAVMYKNNYQEKNQELQELENEEIIFDKNCQYCGSELKENKLEAAQEKAKQLKQTKIDKLRGVVNIHAGNYNQKANEFKAKKLELEKLNDELLEIENKDFATLGMEENQQYKKLIEEEIECQEKLVKADEALIHSREQLKKQQKLVEELKDIEPVLPLYDVQERLMEIQKKLSEYENIDKEKTKLENFKTELKECEKDIVATNTLIDLTKLFINKKNKIISERLAMYFKHVEFVTTEINGYGEEKPTFKLAYQGRIHSTLSTGEKMLIGLDLLNGIQMLKDINIFVLADSLGEISELPSIHSQVIGCKTVEKITENHPKFKEYNMAYSKVYHEKL